MEQLLTKLEAHLAPRRPGSRGEPELRRYVLLSNTFKAAQKSIPPPPRLDQVGPSFDMYDMMDQEEVNEDEVWLTSCLDELVRADEEAEEYGLQMVVYKDQQVPEAMFNYEEDEESEEDELPSSWMDGSGWSASAQVKHGWQMDPLVEDDGGGGGGLIWE